MPSLRLGTRGSKLALAQAHSIRDLLQSRHPELEIEIVTIRTSGDRGDRNRLGAFVREIQEALLRNEVDVALHCLKDLPTEPVPGLVLGAHLPREDARDTLISRGPGLKSLPEGAVVGTGSLRRTSQLASVRPDLVFRPLVGNVDTRLRKLIEGEYDAIVLAIAGLKRLGLIDDWANTPYAELTVWPESYDTIVPCPGQAVLVLETREGDAEVLPYIAPLNDPVTEAASRAERAYLRAFGGGCSVPIGAYARPTEHGLTMNTWVSNEDGSRFYRSVGSGPIDAPEQLAKELIDLRPEAEAAFEMIREVRARREDALGGGTEP